MYFKLLWNEFATLPEVEAIALGGKGKCLCRVGSSKNLLVGGSFHLAPSELKKLRNALEIVISNLIFFFGCLT